MKTSIKKKLKPAVKRLAIVWHHVSGLPLVAFGVLLLAVFYACGLTNYNALLALSLLLILLGIISYVGQEKAASKY